MPTIAVARKLLGKYLLRKNLAGQWIGGKIVETEAYLHTSDPASHSFRGKTNRNAAMFAPPGTLYVYTIHAKYCLNLSTEREGIGEAVLIRALQPLWGIHKMQENRSQTDLRRLTGGPAMLCQALEINLLQNGCQLEKSDWLAITDGEKVADKKIITTSRIGISRGRDLPLRFVIAETQFASRPSRKHDVMAMNLPGNSQIDCADASS